jgi:succinyl-CoA synthetase alpha subunit
MLKALQTFKGHSQVCQRRYAGSDASKYASTISKLRLTPSTRVLYQGFTGRVSTANAAASIKYGTNIVGGTTPGKSGTHLDLPLYPSVREAAEKLKPDATAVFVGANHAAKAIEEAVAAEIGLVVAVAEFLPVHDVLRVSLHGVVRKA